MPRVRRILHVDMDAFYASIEQRDRPDLRGRPVVVGREASERGVVAAASYEARTFGIHSAMPMARAVRLCPTLAVVHPDFEKYRTVSGQVFAIFRSVTPLVEPLSLDEAYLDVSENAWGEPLGMTVARRIKAMIREQTGLTASAGVAPNKFLAKIASGWKKPDGLTVVAPERVESFLHGLSVDALFGVGPVTAGKLHGAGIRTLMDVRAAGETRLHEVVGNLAGWLVQLAHGLDDRDVEPERPAKSSGTETTYAEDLHDTDRIRQEVASMAGEGAAWLARHALFARTVTIKVRYSNFQTITRSSSAWPATRDENALATRAVELLQKTEAGRRPVRLLGVTVHNFSDTPGEPPPARPTRRLPLFDP
ncbi:MAG TPA: DNA polymerase IV [Vicinamibacterales bacterium]|nr:DNA polymerase IV [Vicinamibacterales bacterium]